MRENQPLRRLALALTVVAATLASTHAQTRPGRPTSRPAARPAKGKPQKPGKVRRAYGQRWEPSLTAALERAGKGKRRPVLWFRVLGDLTGFA